MESPNDFAFSAWNRLVESHKALSEASREFLTGTFDRVAVIRKALGDHDKHTAIYVLRSLKRSELQDLFDVLIFHASYSHGALGSIRDAILSLPRDWVLARIEEVAEPLLANGTYDEFRRLLELYALLDPVLTRRLAERAAQDPDPDIREAGGDFLA